MMLVVTRSAQRQTVADFVAQARMVPERFDVMGVHVGLARDVSAVLARVAVAALHGGGPFAVRDYLSRVGYAALPVPVLSASDRLGYFAATLRRVLVTVWGSSNAALQNLRHSGVVVVNELLRLTPDPSEARIVARRKWCRLSTAAAAQASAYAVSGALILAAVMAVGEPQWLTVDDASRRVGLLRDSGGVSAAAFTKHDHILASEAR